jgi:SAM-dependent methyltransferase
MSKIIGHIDSVSSSEIIGWAADLEDKQYIPLIKICNKSSVILQNPVNCERPDVQECYGLEHAFHGFVFKLDISLEIRENLSFYVIGRDGSITNLPFRNEVSSNRQVPKYQSFESREGHSSSKQKLEALKLEQLDLDIQTSSRPPLAGKSVLDLGCNEGFFCQQALLQGASRVVGCDSDLRYLDLARQRCPQAEFLHSTWWNLPDEKFDVIFFLSAIHYEDRQRELLTELKRRLTPNGVLVLECGVILTGGRHQWYSVRRWDGLRKYPTQDMLVHTLLADYAVRNVGASINQEGDPVSRYVYHCRVKKTTALLLEGPSGSGKSVFAGILAYRGFPVYDLDSLFLRFVSDQLLPSEKLIDHIQSAKLWGSRDVSKILIWLDNNSSHVEEIVNVCLSELPPVSNVLIIEGCALQNKLFKNMIIFGLIRNNINVWQASPTLLPGF